ncbi:UNVERIFIED_CONTAM: hypothetical protein K2H54_056090 [Gekko kuhli]
MVFLAFQAQEEEKDLLGGKVSQVIKVLLEYQTREQALEIKVNKEPKGSQNTVTSEDTLQASHEVDSDP